MTTSSITGYLAQLRTALEGSDTAIIQDALSDAEEHLRTALENAQNNENNFSKTETLQAIITEYGTPEEIAEAYREIEAYTRPVWSPASPRKQRNIFARFFGIFVDPQAWGALIYLLLSLITGVLYFCWAFIGVSTSLIFSLFIFGLPLAAFFLLSIRGVALFEGRIIEALLGIRMPRRTVFTPENLNWRERLWAQLKDNRTWFILVYLFLQGILGYLYFSIFVLLIATALLFMGMPILSSLGLPIATVNGQQYFATLELLPVAVIFGFLFATVVMHFAKFVGNLHGRYAKFMLVGE